MHTGGFSMGGRESLYIGIKRPDLFGYIAASSPAPGGGHDGNVGGPLFYHFIRALFKA